MRSKIGICYEFDAQASGFPCYELDAQASGFEIADGVDGLKEYTKVDQSVKTTRLRVELVLIGKATKKASENAGLRVDLLLEPRINRFETLLAQPSHLPLLHPAWLW